MFQSFPTEPRDDEQRLPRAAYLSDKSRADLFSKTRDDPTVELTRRRSTTLRTSCRRQVCWFRSRPMISSVINVKALVAQMKTIIAAISEYDRHIEALCQTHDDY